MLCSLFVISPRTDDGSGVLLFVEVGDEGLLRALFFERLILNLINAICYPRS